MTNDERRTTNDERRTAEVDFRPSSSVLRPRSLSVAIIARDEQRHIADALTSVAGLATEVVVLLDSRTRDQTALICQAHGARVIVEAWRGYAPQRNRVLDLCIGDWVLLLDADERLTGALADEIRAVLSGDRETRRPGDPETGAICQPPCLRVSVSPYLRSLATGFRATIASSIRSCAAAAGIPIINCGCCGVGAHATTRRDWFTRSRSSMVRPVT
jgi:glycosyltransferase involved in cell wall biosynthesis